MSDSRTPRNSQSSQTELQQPNDVSSPPPNTRPPTSATHEAIPGCPPADTSIWTHNHSLPTPQFGAPLTPLGPNDGCFPFNSDPPPPPLEEPVTTIHHPVIVLREMPAGMSPAEVAALFDGCPLFEPPAATTEADASSPPPPAEPNVQVADAGGGYWYVAVEETKIDGLYHWIAANPPLPGVRCRLKRECRSHVMSPSSNIPVDENPMGSFFPWPQDPHHWWAAGVEPFDGSYETSRSQYRGGRGGGNREGGRGGRGSRGGRAGRFGRNPRRGGRGGGRDFEPSSRPEVEHRVRVTATDFPPLASAKPTLEKTTPFSSIGSHSNGEQDASNESDATPDKSVDLPPKAQGQWGPSVVGC